MQRIGFVVFSGYQVMSFAALSVFEIANQQAGRQVYDVHVLSEDGGLIRTSIGMTIGTERFDDATYDTLIIGGGGVLEPPTPGLVDFVRRSFGRSRRITSICSGAFVLAEAGLLDGRRATTHWIYARAFQSQFPKVKMEEDRIFIQDGPGLDLGRHVGGHRSRSGTCGRGSRDRGWRAWSPRSSSSIFAGRRAVAVFGAARARAEIGSHPERPVVRQAQSSHAADGAGSCRCRAAQPTTVQPRIPGGDRAVAGQGCRKSPRGSRARDDGGRPSSIDVVAQHTGFADRDRMRRAFLRAFGQPPQVMRRNARATAPAD